MAVSIEFYSDWMKEQVVELFCNQYEEDKVEFSLFFNQFYEGDFQKDKAIKIVAIEGRKVVGFQSFFYWPYQKGENKFNSFQSGNSLVHPEYRGQGLFKKMLEFTYVNQAEIGVDFLVGFPVQASFNSFVRNNWVNLFNLQWYIKILNYIAPIVNVFTNVDKELKKAFNLAPKYETILGLENKIELAEIRAFKQWRKSYAKDILYYFLFEEGDDFIEFELKYNIRKKIFGEIVIGGVNTNSTNTKFIKKSLKLIFKKVKKLNFVTLVSVAINEDCNTVFNKEVATSFKRIEKQIYFIVKGVEKNSILNESKNWDITRSHIDTW